MVKKREPYRSLKEWLEIKFALRRLDNALFVLTSLASIVFTISNAIFGKGPILYFLPLYFIGWMMPIWSGYFLGAIIRRNVIDRMRGWIYLLAGSPSYLFSLFYGSYAYLLTLGPGQLDPLSLPGSLLLFAAFHSIAVLVAVLISLRLVRSLFKTVTNGGIMNNMLFPGKTLIFTFVAIALFTGSLSVLLIWSTFGVSFQLILAVVVTFFTGLLFEYLAVRTTRGP